MTWISSIAYYEQTDSLWSRFTCIGNGYPVVKHEGTQAHSKLASVELL